MSRTPKRTKRRAKSQLPLRLRKGRKTDVRSQFAALCWREAADGVEVCLVTSRRSKRWILPKGWPMNNTTPAKAAATEAWEEAGIRGRAINHCLGVYADVKQLPRGMLPVVIMVYPIAAQEVFDTWPEAGQRKRRWLSPKKAAKKIKNPALARIVKKFDPATLPPP